eukprot:TRINITY_DN5043_c0_g1_i1.p1 TRINITY_DN5043_c0_g1~~TRINITY_DN5043_c0_g1_i1.p1  ORF type:complete len:1015 (+),score=211.33 TRINITY_DN5043_c0_g1_i1:410-3046(+)
MEGLWSEILGRINAVPLEKFQVPTFWAFQDEILRTIENNTAENREIAIEACNAILKPKLKELVTFFGSKSCPNTHNAKLFDKLGIPPPMRNTEITEATQMSAQLNRVDAVDRGLDFKSDPRCENFRPTGLQRTVLDSIDANKNVILCSGTGTGKTMISIYFAKKMQMEGKKTIFVAPNKPLCEEISILVYNQGMTKFSVAHEDFISWEELSEADIIICTPNTLIKILLFPQAGDGSLLDKVGGLVLDEFPRLVRKNGELSTLLFTAATRGWKMVALSATFTDEYRDLLRNELFPDSVFIEAKDSIRPTDVQMYEWDHDHLKSIENNSTYTKSLVEKNPDRCLRYPVRLEEFKDCFEKSKERETFNAMEHLPKDRVVNGVDLSRFCVSYVHNACDDLPEGVTSSSESSSEEEYEQLCPPEEELFELIKTLEKKDMLPALIYHPNSDVLEKYYTYVAEKLDKYMQSREVSKAEEKAANAAKRNASKEDAKEEQSASGPVKVFGGLSEARLREFLTKRRARAVMNSPYYTGMSNGMGIHHHKVSRSIREAVESGLRLSYLQVVFTHGTLCLGLNTATRTVVLVDHGIDKKLFTSENILQASGRAGRWGSDKSGNLVFFGQPHKAKESLWTSFPGVQTGFPIDYATVLAFCATSPSMRNNIRQWLRYNIPYWSWDEEKAVATFTRFLALFKRLKLIDAKTHPTKAGLVSIALRDEGNITPIFAGFVFPYICDLINSREDFFFVFSHFISCWRGKLKGNTGPRMSEILDQELVKISPDLVAAMRKAQEDAKAVRYNLAADGDSELAFELESNFVATDELTGFYVSLLTLSWDSYEGGSSRFELNSYAGHFLEKLRVFQTVARLPFGDQAISDLDILLNGTFAK